MRTHWRSLLRSFVARFFVRHRQPSPTVTPSPVIVYVASTEDDDADIADAWLALEAMTNAALTRAEVEHTLFIEAKYGVLFGQEYHALLQHRRAYLTSRRESDNDDEEQEVAS